MKCINNGIWLIGCLIVFYPVLANAGLIDLSDGLVARYDFETTSRDSSDAGVHGDIYGTTYWTDGMDGNGYSLYLNNPLPSNAYKKNAYFQTPSLAATDFTVSLRTKWEGGQILQNAEYTSHLYTVGKQGVASPYFGITVASNGNLNATISSQGNTVNLLGGSLAKGEWTHITASVEGGNLSLFNDGALVNSASIPFAIDFSGYAHNVGLYQYDVGWSQGEYTRYSGAIDELRIFDRADSGSLNELEVFSLANPDWAPSTAKINLENGESYIIPVLSSQNSLESFYIQDSDGNNIDPDSLSVDKVTKLISASNTLSDMVNFDLKGLENDLATEKTDALGRMTAANGLNISEKVVANASTYLAGVGATALTCSAGAPLVGTVVCGGGAAVYGLAGTLVSIATDVLDSGDQLLLDEYYYTIGKQLVEYSSDKINGEKSYLELVNETLVQVVGQATGESGLDYETLQYASIRYNQHVNAASLGQRFLSMAGEDPDTTQTIIDNSLDPFLLGIPGVISFLENEGDRDVAKTRAELLLAGAYNNHLGNLSPRSFEWNKLRAICQGVISGDCPDNDLGDIASGNKTIDQFFQEGIVIEPTDFGDGTFVGWAPSGPGSAEIALIEDNYLLSLTTGSPVSVTKAIDTPDSSFLLFFDYLFQTDTGFLDVLLNDMLLATIEAPDVLSDDFTRMFITVTDSDLFGLTSVDLVFNFDGPTGSNIYIDNIYASGPSFIPQAQSVPEPGSLLLFIAGLLGLGYANRGRIASTKRA